MTTTKDLLSAPFASLSALLAAHARERGDHAAVTEGDEVLTYAALDERTGRVAAALQAAGVARGRPVAIASAATAAACVAFLGILRAGGVVVPLAPSSTPAQLAAMIVDSDAALVFADADAAARLGETNAPVVPLATLAAWSAAVRTEPAPVDLGPDDAFNIIYSSGTTGTPKGICQTHAMRRAHIATWGTFGSADAITMVATPIYSNTTLVSLLPTLAYGGTVVLLPRFDAGAFVALAERTRATHAMLVPIQYQRIMALPDLDRFDLSAFRVKVCTSAPFAPELKADVLRRWPGALIEIYGMTEGGGTCVLMAHAFPDKLNTVGRPAPGNDIRLIDEAGQEVPVGGIGEVVGRSGMMMSGYHGRADATAATEWRDTDGRRFIRHGDLGRFDADGFLTLLGRTKDMIISGGFNVYPPDIEQVLLDHPGVADAAVIGIPSPTWGETPFAYYVPQGDGVDGAALVAWVNDRVGKTQRLAGAQAIAELPRNDIGKILKRALRDRHDAAAQKEATA